jgi:hypothetical protein
MNLTLDYPPENSVEAQIDFEHMDFDAQVEYFSPSFEKQLQGQEQEQQQEQQPEQQSSPQPTNQLDSNGLEENQPASNYVWLMKGI